MNERLSESHFHVDSWTRFIALLLSLRSLLKLTCKVQRRSLPCRQSPVPVAHKTTPSITTTHRHAYIRARSWRAHLTWSWEKCNEGLPASCSAYLTFGALARPLGLGVTALTLCAKTLCAKPRRGICPETL